MLRFVNYESHFRDDELLLLLRALAANNGPLQRKIFFDQMHLGRRRELSRIEETPVRHALTLRSALEVVERSAIGAFLTLSCRAERLSAKQLFEAVNKDRDPLLTPEALLAAQVALGQGAALPSAARTRWLQAAAAEGSRLVGQAAPFEAVWRWLQAAGTEREMIVSAEAFINLVARASIPECVMARLGSPEGWAPPTGLGHVNEGASRRAHQPMAAEVLRLLRAPLRRYVSARNQRDDVEEARAKATLEWSRRNLLIAYEDEEERKLGANPSVQRSGLTFDFSRSNLPKCIEFHGTPGFLPETHPLYEGKQFFVLHKLDYCAPLPPDPQGPDPYPKPKAQSIGPQPPPTASAQSIGTASAHSLRPQPRLGSNGIVPCVPVLSA